MSESRKKPGWLLWLIVLVILALLGYGGAYGLMVIPETHHTDGGFGPSNVSPYYRGAEGDQAFLAKIFLPAHWLDRRLRAKTWQPE